MNLLSLIGSKAATLKTAMYAMVFSALVASNQAFALAAGLTTAESTILGYVTATLAFIVAIGIAVLGLVMVAKAVKWARKAG